MPFEVKSVMRSVSWNKKRRMRYMKAINRFKKGIAVVLSITMLLGLISMMPGNVFKVQAADENSEPGVTAYAAKAQLMDGTFAPDNTGTATNVGKIKFGKNSDGAPQEWYVLGSDSNVSADNVAIFAASSIGPDQMFQEDGSVITVADLGENYDYGTYTDSNPAEVYVNHYGASKLRKYLIGELAKNTNYFSTAEQGLMQATTVITNDSKNDKEYTTSDKLYAPDGKYSGYGTEISKTITVGNNIKLQKDKYWTDGGYFWLRSPYTDSVAAAGSFYYVHIAVSNYGGVLYNDVMRSAGGVRPASNLNLSSVLFASSAQAAVSDAEVAGTIAAGTAMTLRLDGNSKNIGTIAYNVSEGTIKGTRGSVTSAAIVVQGNNAGTDWYYSKMISGNEISVTTDEMKSKLSESITAISDPSDINLENCRIWLETTGDDGLSYVVEAAKESNTPSVTARTLNLADGYISITPTGYSQNGSAEVAFTGKYIITGTTECDTPLRFFNNTDDAVVYDVTFDNAHIIGGAYCTAIAFRDETKSAITLNITNKGKSEVRAWGGPSFAYQITGNVEVNVNITEEEGSSLYLGPRDKNQGDTAHRIYSTSIACMVNGTTPDNATVFKSGEYETEESTTKTNIALGTSIIADPTAPTTKTDAWQGSYVYYGSYGTSGVGSSGTAEPVKYRVLDSSTSVFGGTTMLLDCDSILWTGMFDSSSNVWSDSYIRNYLNGFMTTAFSTLEQNAIAESTKSEPGSTDGGGVSNLNYVALNGDKIFLLDAKEATNTKYGYSNTYGKATNRIKTYNSSNFWWLRSSRTDNGNTGVCGTDGSMGDRAIDGKKNNVGVSPALNINLSSVLFSSVISGTAGQTGAEYKLTLLDSDLRVANDGVTRDKNTISVKYATYGPNSQNVTQVSVLILDKEYTPGNTNDAKVLAYGALNMESFATYGTGTFILPSDLSDKVCGSDYYAYIVAEDVNGEKETDYASTPVKITVIYNEISDVNVAVDAPVAGASLDTSATVPTTVTGTTVTWTASGSEVTGNALYNTVYTGKVILMANSGYVFTDTVAVTVNGTAATSMTKNADGTLIVTYTFPATAKDKLTAITAPSEITVANGTEYENMNLPEKVTIITEGNTVTEAGVSWDTSEPASGSYDSSVLTEQSVTLKGAITCPATIDANDVSLTTTITIKISAAGITGAPTANPVAGTYTDNQKVTLTSSTPGAVIYYTTDGTKPSASNGTKYTAPISVTGAEGESVVTTIRAIAVKDGMQNSEIQAFTYIISIPHVHKAYRIIDGANSSWTQNIDGSVVIKGNGDFLKFQAVKVDGMVLDAKNYIAAEGSTIITLKADYLKTLSAGSHTFEIVWTDGSASTNFTIVKNTSDDSNPEDKNDSEDTTKDNQNVTAPQTGDTANPPLWIMLLVASLVGLAGVLIKSKRKNDL